MAPVPNSMEHLVQDGFRLLMTHINIDNVDFATKSFRVYSKMTLMVTEKKSNFVCLKIGKGIKLPSEDASGDCFIRVNDSVAEHFRFASGYIDPSNMTLNNLKETLRTLHNTNQDKDRLIIAIPDEVVLTPGEHIFIEFCVMVVKPNNVYFYSAEQRTHCYTFKCINNPDNSEWIPCFDDITQISKFIINITTENYYNICASGEHVNTTTNGIVHTYTFHVSTYTFIGNIGFAFGRFDELSHSGMDNITFHCPDGYKPCMDTTSNLFRLVKIFDEFLNHELPFKYLSIVFVYELPDDYVSYAGLCLFSVTTLQSKFIIDNILENRFLFANAYAAQFFGCYIQPRTYPDLWLVNSISKFLVMMYVEKSFGTCEYIFQIEKTIRDVCEYEENFGKICLHPCSADDAKGSFHDTAVPSLTSKTHFEMVTRKGMLFIRMIRDRFTTEQLLKVLNRILSAGSICNDSTMKHNPWNCLTLSPVKFNTMVYKTTGQDIPSEFGQWVYGAGHARFDISYSYNRKKNMLDFMVHQHPGFGRLSYKGPLHIFIQEIDDAFSHILQIDKDLFEVSLPCHAKSRNKKKKKVTLSMGEEVSVDFTRCDPEIPILWISVDPHLLLIREVQLNQPLINFEMMLQYERNVCSQLHAIQVFQNGSSTVQTIDVLYNAVLDFNFYIKVRTEAIKALGIVRSKFYGAVVTSKGLIELAEEWFGCRSQPNIVATNNFHVLQEFLEAYSLQKEFSKAIGAMRHRDLCPLENIRFIVNLIMYNNNSKNRFSDDYLRAAYIDALQLTLTPSDDGTFVHDTAMRELVTTEIVNCFNVEHIVPSTNRVVLIACLKCFCTLQCMKHVPLNVEFFMNFMSSKKHTTQVRATSFMCVVQILKTFNRKESFMGFFSVFMDLAKDDHSQMFLERVLKELIENPPFRYNEDRDLKTVEINVLANYTTMWTTMVNENIRSDLRWLFFDVCYVMFGISKPLFKGMDVNGILPVDIIKPTNIEPSIDVFSLF